MSDIVIFDTSVLVDELRTGRHRKRIESAEGLVRTSSVVLAELLRGVIGPTEPKFLRSLARNYSTLTPTEKNWLNLAIYSPTFAPIRLRAAQTPGPSH